MGFNVCHPNGIAYSGLLIIGLNLKHIPQRTLQSTDAPSRVE